MLRNGWPISLFFFSLLTLPVFAIPVYGDAVFRFDAMIYTVEEGACSHECLSRFHQIFLESADRSYERFQVRKPEEFRAVIVRSADSFRRRTGQPGFVGGLYLPEVDIFVFQNPSALERRGGLANFLGHEICHQILIRMADPHAGRREWLEESLCQAVNPTSRREAVVAVPVNYSDLGIKISRGLVSTNRTERSLANQLARLWGEHVTAKIGAVEFAAEIAAGRLDKIQSHFESFRALFRR